MLCEKRFFVGIIACLSICIVLSFAANEQCIKGFYHKSKPSAETAAYKFCTPWKDLTCCTQKLDNEIDQNDSPIKYNDSWHLCGNLSAECLNYWKRQECFYQCSPYVYPWKHAKYEDAIRGVPICASECDNWYEACKNDLTCVENFLEDFNVTHNYVRVCPKDKKCVTYAAMYGSGKNLCTKMWGDSYKYVKKDGDNCMKFWFTPGSKNPNANVMKEVGGSVRPSVIFRQLVGAVLFALLIFNV